MSWWGMQGLQGAAGRAATTEEKVRLIAESGFGGINGAIPSPEEEKRWKELLRGHGLAFSVNAYPRTLQDLSAFLERASAFGDIEYVNAQVMQPFVTGDEAKELLAGMNRLSEEAGIPVFFETHRGTITQDLIRTAEYARALPALPLTIDYSHYVVAGELHTVSDEAEALLQNLLPHAASIHMRISNGEQVQIDPGEEGEHPMVAHFARWWEGAMRGWLHAQRRRTAAFPVVAELGPPSYAITTDEAGGRKSEIGDRWTQSLYLKRLAEQVWEKASSDPI
ncbi:sugar phosphate isomerase/epimerase [Paenibacillus sp. IB182493]|uniref:Sugar phosphate isomerase/epimerase n=2 Tax=Paenibacillus arenilitoris TaxID=2772299 RepID=A0A927CG30_9BACL|nr:sugar phosphate isomerase/epimerase [Paenibacillus arenilitoris]